MPIPMKVCERLQRAAAAQREAEAMSNPANCFNPVDYGPPASALSPRVAEVYRRKAEKQARFLESEFCQAERRKVAEAQERAEAARRERERKEEEAKKAAEEERARRVAEQREAQRQYNIWFSKPESKLLVAYDLLHRVQYCRQVRDATWSSTSASPSTTAPSSRSRQSRRWPCKWCPI
jgi:hypothetical protein